MMFVYDAIGKDAGKALREKNPDPHFLQNHHQIGQAVREEKSQRPGTARYHRYEALYRHGRLQNEVAKASRNPAINTTSRTRGRSCNDTEQARAGMAYAARIAATVRSPSLHTVGTFLQRSPLFLPAI